MKTRFFLLATVLLCVPGLGAEPSTSEAGEGGQAVVDSNSDDSTASSHRRTFRQFQRSADEVAPAPKARLVFKTYVVESGDTLGAIAKAHRTTSKALIELNEIADPKLIRPGQELKVGLVEIESQVEEQTSSSEEAESLESVKQPELLIHEVAAGETYSKIASLHGITVPFLLGLNPGVDPKRLQLGQKIRIGTPPIVKTTPLDGPETGVIARTDEPLEEVESPSEPEEVEVDERPDVAARSKVVRSEGDFAVSLSTSAPRAPITRTEFRGESE